MGGLEPGNLSRGLTDYLDRELTIRVKVMPVEVMGPTRRRYDRHGRRILVSEMLPLPSRNLQLALQLALIRYRALLDRMAAEARFPNAEAARGGRDPAAHHPAAAQLIPNQRLTP